MTAKEFKIGDKIAAAVRTGNDNPALRVGVIERIHDRTYSIGARRFTIRNSDGKATVVSEDRSVLIEADEYHTMAELYEYRMLYNAHAVRDWITKGYPVVKSARHHDGEKCFGGGWFIVIAELPSGQVSNHYEWGYWELFDVPTVERAPEWDGHTPHEASVRLMDAL